MNVPVEPSRILIGDTIEQMGTLPEKCVQCCVTSPPYWGLRDYGVDGQIGLESTPEEFVAKMVDVGRAGFCTTPQSQVGHAALVWPQ